MALSKDIDTLMADNPALPSYPGADEEAAEKYTGERSALDYYNTPIDNRVYRAFLAGSRHKESQMRGLIEAAVKSERQRISKAFCENSVNRGVFAEIPKEVFDDIINPVADDSGVE